MTYLACVVMFSFPAEVSNEGEHGADPAGAESLEAMYERWDCQKGLHLPNDMYLVEVLLVGTCEVKEQRKIRQYFRQHTIRKTNSDRQTSQPYPGASPGPTIRLRSRPRRRQRRSNPIALPISRQARPGFRSRTDGPKRARKVISAKHVQIVAISHWCAMEHV